jgi:hypothetical protein
LHRGGGLVADLATLPVGLLAKPLDRVSKNALGLRCVLKKVGRLEI